MPGCFVLWWCDDEKDVSCVQFCTNGNSNTRIRRAPDRLHANLILLTKVAPQYDDIEQRVCIVLMSDTVWETAPTFCKWNSARYRSLSPERLSEALSELLQCQDEILRQDHPLTVLVPYRNRALHLSELLQGMQHYDPAARIVVANQVDDWPFNAGAVRNIAFLEAVWKYPETSWVCFMDVDNVPQSSLVTIPQPEANQVIKVFGHYHSVGGIWTIRTVDFLKVDGYPTNFWAWGMEDMLLQRRLCLVGHLAIQQPTYVRGCQTVISDPDHERTYNAVSLNQAKFDQNIFEGLTTFQYTVDSLANIQELNCTIIRARITHPSPSQCDL